MIDRDVVLSRLSLSVGASVDEIYRAWCLTIPFDNIRKLRHLRSGGTGPLPGATPEDFFGAYLADGVGGTCWPTSGALVALLLACGIDAWRVAATMRDDLIPADSQLRPNHGGVLARVGGDVFLVDPSMLTDEPLLLAGAPTENTDPLVGADATPLAGGEWLVTFGPWRPDGRLQCRLDAIAIDDRFCADRYEFSRTDSPFNERLYVRRNYADRVQILSGDELWVMRRSGPGTCERVGEQRSLTEILVGDFGISESAAAGLDN